MFGTSRQQVPIAIVGVSALFPGSSDARGFWSDILAGKDLTSEVPATHWLIEDYYDADPAARDKTYGKRGAFLSPVDFDPMEFGVPPSIVPAIDTAQILALMVAQKVLDDASQGQFANMDRERISVLLGVTSAQELVSSMSGRLQKPIWLKALRESGIPEDEAQAICEKIADGFVPWQESSFPGLLGNVVAGRIANRFDLRGTNAVADAACASSFAAISMGVNELQLGQSDLVISGGVDAMNSIFMFMCFSKTPALSPTGDCRPFSDAADGTLLGEGLGMFALKRLADAERDGDRIYAVIRGIGSASDGRAKSVYAPLPEGQSRALLRAYEAAGYGPDSVELVEAHGTGTKAGDAAEFEGLRSAFGKSPGARMQWCALGSVKSQIGHTKAAAGAAGLFKAVMALHHKVLPPTIKVERPNPKLEIESSPFYLNTQTRPWIRDASHPRRASVSSFGFGGSNFHITLEEYVPGAGSGESARRLRTAPAELVLLSAPDAAQLIARCRSIAAGKDRLARVARISQSTFRTGEAARLAIVASSVADLVQKLEAAVAAIEANPAARYTTPHGVHYSPGEAAPGEIAFLFPGQGSQYLGMGADVAMEFDAARKAWDAAAAIDFAGERLQDVVFPRPVFTDEQRAAQADRLTATEWAQPALGVQSLALAGVLQSIGVHASCVAGHSFGEVTALAHAGVFDPETFVKVARRRGELMRDASGVSGAMTAVPLPVEQVKTLLETEGSDVVIANHNGPNQVVLSGSTEAIARIEVAFAAQGVSARRLVVATAFHSPLVAGSSGPFLQALAEQNVYAPKLDVYGNADALPYPNEPQAVRERLAAQLAQPVRFVEQVEAMYARGVRTFIEVGAGSVLTELVGRILGERAHCAVNLDRKGRHGVTALLDALGRLAVGGVAMDFSALWEAYAQEADEPEKKPAMTMPISGANYGSPYPPAGGARALPPPNPPRGVASGRPAAAAIPQPSISPPAMSAAAPPAAAATDPSAAHLAWVQAYQETQRQTADAHAAYQRAMSDTHIAFLNASGASLASLSAMLTGAPSPAVPFIAASPEPAMHPASIPPASSPIPPAPVAAQAFLQPTPAMATAPVVAPVSTPATVPALDLEALMLDVVAEKTGYPKEMLTSEMELEADLGIDSIKRVEILSAMRERAPGLGEVQPAEMAALRTLGQIVERLRSDMAGAVVPPSSVSAAVPALDLEALMLDVVAEKTGYPKEMLTSEMELEADLGIDSIKRVEILSAMRERAPGLGEVQPAEMAALRTLGQIVERLRQGTVDSDAPAVENMAQAKPMAVPEPSVQRLAVREMDAPAATGSLPGLTTGKRVQITDDGQGVAQELAVRLAAGGVRAEIVRTVSAEADVVLFLGGLRAVASVDEAVAVNREAFLAAQTVAKRMEAHGGVFVTVQDTGGDFGLRGVDGTRAWLGGISALARTAALEWPNVSVKCIDCERGGRDAGKVADAIVGELLGGGTMLEVGLHADGRRTTPATLPAPVSAAVEARLDRSSVIVASGGARGVTAACLVALAKARQPRIVLLGRSKLSEEPAELSGEVDEVGLKRACLSRARAEGRNPSPTELSRQVAALMANREIRATLAALQAAGSEVRYCQVDVQDSAAISAALEPVRGEWGPITAVVHGAGVLADKRIVEKSFEQFDKVFQTKVAGLRALLAATRQDDLAALCVFSSVAARSGNPGQCDYAMANEVLNLVASAEAARRGDACAVRAIAWGPWDGGMVTPALKTHFERQGVPLIPLQVGADMFVGELLSAGSDVNVLLCGVSRNNAPLSPQAPRAELEVRVDANSHPYLGDHRIAGVPVLPMALAIEWLQRAAYACRPDLVCTTIRDLKVLRGIKLHAFDGQGDRFVVSCQQLSNGSGSQLSAEIRGAQGELHYSALVEMATHAAAPPAPASAPVLEPWAASTIYDGTVLFHGPRFRAVRSIEGISRAGLAGVIAGNRELSWPTEAWNCDVPAIDGALQLAVLWSRHVLGGAVLPMSMKAFCSFRQGVTEGTMRCVVHARSVEGAHTSCDILMTDASGTAVAQLLGVETVLRPDSQGLEIAAAAGLR